MKREILFRGKRVDNGDLVYGLLIESKNGECHILVKNYNPIKKQGNGHWYIDAPCFQVHPETVCQFTGLLDKNGNKIFEGDKVITERMRFSESQELTVLLHNFRFKFYSGNIGYIDLFEFCLFDKNEITNHTNLEITGNIHDKYEV